MGGGATAQPTRGVFHPRGRGQLCVDGEIREVHGGQVAYVPPHAFHQLTNIGDSPCGSSTATPRAAVAHWAEAAGIAKAGVGAHRFRRRWPQCRQT